MGSPVRLPIVVRRYHANSPRQIRFGLLANVRSGGHGRSEQGGRRYRSGDTVRQSGIYEVVHDREHRDVHEVVMISGERFPDCETCKERVRFRLIRTAPYIFQDQDFEEQ